ncbi:c-type cytochrome [Lutibacter sp.]
MKKYKILGITTLALGILTVLMLKSCSAEQVATYQNKSGAQLWGENCIRCHNTPSPAAYNDTDWTTIGLHMRIRANLSKEQSEKIFAFIKSAN